MPTHYTWTDITVPNSAVKGSFKKISVGKEVTRSEIGDDWDGFLAAGVIRTTPYPKDVRTSESPRNAILRKANEEMKKASEPFKHELDPDDE